MKAKNTNKSLLRAMSVIKSFTPGELELGVVDIARKVGIPTSTAHRILATLIESGMIDRNPKTRNYTIGPALYALGSLYLSSTDMTRTADPVIKMLNDLMSEVISVAILSRGNVIMVLREESRSSFRWNVHVGTILPAYSAAIGKALLSELTETQLDSLYPEERLRPVTTKTIATKTELKLELEQIRETGIAFDREGSSEGVEGIASVIWDASGKAVAAMSIGVPLFRVNQAIRERLATLVKMGAKLVSYRLGYQDVDNPIRDIEEIRSWWKQNQLDSASQANSLARAVPIGRNGIVEGERD